MQGVNFLIRKLKEFNIGSRCDHIASGVWELLGEIVQNESGGSSFVYSTPMGYV